MITVKLRDINYAEAHKIGEVDFSQVDSFLARLRHEGVHSPGMDTSHEVVMQWVVDPTNGEAFLEMIVGEIE